ncbi:MAG: hypothetical protein JWL77_2288 [Chthonomonadaceae bacterium]|nr:hypothetical protein [Chthonomonadaceae bacterium]
MGVALSGAQLKSPLIWYYRLASLPSFVRRPMTIRRSDIPPVLTRVLTGVTCILLSQGFSFAQAATDPLQTDPPPAPRYRRARPVFQVSADPNSKPLPPPIIIHDPPPDPPPAVETPLTGITPTPTSKEIAAKQEAERRDAENDRQHDRMVNLGKGVGVLVVVCIGVFAAADVARQIRKSNRSAQDEEEDEWEP